MANSLNDNMAAYFAALMEGIGSVVGGQPASIPTVQQSTSQSDTNVVTSPSANAVLATVTVPATGVYQVEVVSAIGGTTVAATEMNNMRLRVNNVAVGRVLTPVPGTAGGTGIGQKKARIAATSGQVIDVIAVLAGTTGAVYGCDLVVSRMS